MHNEAPNCLITGANGGIGRALVNIFHNAGYKVIATDVAPNADRVQCDHYLEIDLARLSRDETYAASSIREVQKLLGGRGLRALVNNAAVQILGGAAGLTRESWRETMDVNVFAPFFLTQAFLQELEQVSGCVLNIGSIHARLTKKDFVAYATSKAALAGMTRALAVDIGPRIRINAIEPAAIETDMLKAGFADNPAQYAALESCHPQMRIGDPEEVARLALAIVDGGMNFLHGSCVAIDGGIGNRLFDPV